MVYLPNFLLHCYVYALLLRLSRTSHVCAALHLSPFFWEEGSCPLPGPALQSSSWQLGFGLIQLALFSFYSVAAAFCPTLFSYFCPRQRLPGTPPHCSLSPLPSCNLISFLPFAFFLHATHAFLLFLETGLWGFSRSDDPPCQTWWAWQQQHAACCDSNFWW